MNIDKINIFFFLVLVVMLVCCETENHEDNFCESGNPEELGFVVEPLMNYKTFTEYDLLLSKNIFIKKITKYEDKFVVSGFDYFFITDPEFNELESYKTKNISDQILHEGRIYIASNEGLFRITGSNIEHVYTKTGIADIEIDHSNRFLFLKSTGQSGSLVIFEFNEEDLTVDPVVEITDPEIGFATKFVSVSENIIMTVEINDLNVSIIKGDSLLSYEKPIFTKNFVGWVEPPSSLEKQNGVVFFMFKDAHSNEYNGQTKSLFKYVNEWKLVYIFDKTTHQKNQPKYELIRKADSFTDFLWFEDNYYSLSSNGIVKYNEAQQDFYIVQDPNLIDDDGNYTPVRHIFKTDINEILLTSIRKKIFKIEL